MVPARRDQKQSKPQPEADVKSCSGESLSSTCRSWRQDWTKPTRSGRWSNTPSDGEPHASQHSEHRQRQPLVPSRLTRGNKASEEEKRHQQDIPVSLAGNPPQFYQTEIFKPLVAHRSWRCAEAEESCLFCSADRGHLTRTSDHHQLLLVAEHRSFPARAISQKLPSTRGSVPVRVEQGKLDSPPATSSQIAPQTDGKYFVPPKRRGKGEAALGKAGRHTPGISFSISLGLAQILSPGIKLPVRYVTAVSLPRQSRRSGAERWLLPAVLVFKNS